MLGPALEPYRSRVFLACKTQARDRVGALKELDESLGRMRTDHFDLYQFHAVTKVDDVRKIFGPDGAMEAFQQAKQAGKIRYMGFSAHSVEAATALMDEFDFDTILFPFNYGTWHAGNFGPQVLERAKSKQMGLLALKAMAKGPWLEGAQRDRFPKCWYEPFSTEHEVSLGLRFTLSHPITSAVPPGDENLFRMAMQEAVRFRPLEAREAEELKRMAATGKPLFSYPSTSA
jgi:predicted aldo/keto reductase-like oxidoreductase